MTALDILNLTPAELMELDVAISTIHMAIEKMLLANWVNTREDRPFSGFLFVMNGQIRYCSEKIDVIANKNDLLYLKKKSSYTLTATGGKRIEYILVNFDFLDDGETFERIAFPHLFTPHGEHKYLDLFTQLEETYFYCTTGYRIKMRSILANIVLNLVNDYLMTVAPLGNIGRLMPAVNYIEANFDSDIDMDELSRMTEVSPTHFRRLFSQLYGMSPKEYIIKLRIDKAKMLLQNNSNTVGSIAEKTGFSDTAYFCKVFKRFTGVPPNKYRGKR
jgi:AraC-like DNA-binding protein